MERFGDEFAALQTELAFNRDPKFRPQNRGVICANRFFKPRMDAKHFPILRRNEYIVAPPLAVPSNLFPAPIRRELNAS